MTLYHVPTADFVQKTLDAELLSGTTASATLNNTTNIQNKTGVMIVNRINSNNEETPSSVEVIGFSGTSGSTVITLTRALAGTTAKDHAVNSIVEFGPDIVWAQGLIDTLLVEHNEDGTHASTIVKTTGSQSLASKTLVAPIIDDALLINHESSVSTPASGKVALYVKSDDKVYKKNSSGTEAEVGSSILTTTQYAPQGFLINGKIVPSVSSNNLTVALKGLDGNDPSASNPVYCRIGDTVRTITSALSVTKNAGTNWCNAGSAELATKEIDYFVYLGYNATDGVVIGFSRIPFATSYGDFSATTTNEKYAAISTITTAASTDYYELVGRFAATLSAGAGYTWSVPTFTATNLIQKPIYETRELNYVPTITLPTGMTGTPTADTSYYKISGKKLYAYALSHVDPCGGTITGTDYILTYPFSIIGENNGSTSISVQSSVFSNATAFGGERLSFGIARDVKKIYIRPLAGATWSGATYAYAAFNMTCFIA